MGETLEVQTTCGGKHEQAWDEEAASDHNGKRKKLTRALADRTFSSGSTTRFTCPYFKRNWKKYSQWTSSASRRGKRPGDAESVVLMMKLTKAGWLRWKKAVGCAQASWAHNRTSFPGPGWDEVHRVKYILFFFFLFFSSWWTFPNTCRAHLYRRHALPTQCPRCWEVLKADNLLSSHL